MVIEQLNNLDTSLLLAINGWHNTFLDTFLWNVSQKYTWIAMYAVMVFLLVWRYGIQKKEGKRIIIVVCILIALVTAFGLADWLSHTLKHVICRPRPTREEGLSGILHIVNGYRGGKYGFPSSHAADSFAIALLFSLIWRDWRTTLPLMLWVAMNCWSRMYLGVHYPGDIIAGLLLATVIVLPICFILCKTGIIKKGETQVSPSWLEYALPAVFILSLTICAIV